MINLLLFAAAPANGFWPNLVPVLLGLAAIYLLLPRPQPFPRLWGAAAGGLALLSAGWLLLRGGEFNPESVLFYAFSAIAIASGTLLVTQHNPVKAALSFALVVLSTCGLFLLQAAPFLMAATIIVYAGAIIVTFLFVIMLAQQAGLSSADSRSREPLLATVAGFALLGALLYVLQATYDTRGLDALLGQVLRALDKPTPAQMVDELGDRDDFLIRFQDESKKLRGLSVSQPLLEKALKDLDAQWNTAEGDKLRRALAEVYAVGSRIQAYRFGSVEPPASAPLSAYSGTPANVAVTDLRLDRGGVNVAMPAESVVGLGRSLFTDYLLAVELGGTLLLVATIGAIAIAGRRAEGVR
jgi:NADH:ubiquinone oxidoreductase subunit 6 (subunit J)